LVYSFDEVIVQCTIVEQIEYYLCVVWYRTKNLIALLQTHYGFIYNIMWNKRRISESYLRKFELYRVYNCVHPFMRLLTPTLTFDIRDGHQPSTLSYGKQTLCLVTRNLYPMMFTFLHTYHHSHFLGMTSRKT